MMDTVHGKINKKTPQRNHKLKLSVPRVCHELFF